VEEVKLIRLVPRCPLATMRMQKLDDAYDSKAVEVTACI
jgi:hypothetical protein